MSSDSIGQETDALVRKLIALSNKDKRLVKSSIHQAPADPSIEVQSWKMNEFKYATYPSPFPTLARGLFTRCLPGRGATNGESAEPNDQASAQDEVSLETGGRHVIVARGYDKFFNIGEVPWNTWPTLEKNTSPPYYLTLKSNGCIIFIAALANDKLVVTSKHSLGQRLEGESSHAMQGQKWLHRHLKDKQKTPEELASRLMKDNITAVAELCDDSFEEHVLAYPPELTGLHLHGLNKNQGAFLTAPPSEVDAFAEEFGFIKTAYRTLNSIQEVREFTDHVAEAGAWNGDAVEGFVVRTKVKHRDSSESPARVDARDKHSLPPYPSGSDFFFKVKFDEPYLMYRGWREITKAILAHKHNPTKPLGIPRSRLERPESRIYRDWVEKEINAHPKEFQDFAKGRGIVAARERFLEWLGTSEGQKKLVAAGGTPKTGGAHAVVKPESDPPAAERKFGKTVIVPIAVPGCGKTTLAVALSRLFGFAHTQSDNIKAKKTAPTFQKNITELLLENNVVIADRNNHLMQHREGIREATRKYEEDVSQKNGSESLPTRLIALHWNIRKMPMATTHRICADRILRRGDNHQSLRPSAVVEHEEIIWQFITHSEELTEGEVDDIIEMDISTESLEEGVKRAIDGLLPLLPDLQRPNEGQIAEACDFALGYQVTIKKGDIPTKGKDKGPRYYGVLVEIDIPEIVGQAVLRPGVPAEVREFWEKLRKENRYTPRPHVTIVHAKSLPAKQPLWDACAAVNRPPDLTKVNNSSVHISPMFEFSIGSLLCDSDVMALTIKNLHVRKDDESIVGHEGATALLDLMGEDVKNKLHVTIGTRDQSVLPMLAGDMVTRWRKGERVGIKEVPFGDQAGCGRVKGLS